MSRTSRVGISFFAAIRGFELTLVVDNPYKLDWIGGRFVPIVGKNEDPDAGAADVLWLRSFSLWLYTLLPVFDF